MSLLVVRFVFLLLVQFSWAKFCSKGWVPSIPLAECLTYLDEETKQKDAEPQECNVPVSRTASGNCVCADETSVPSHGCVHEPYVCEERCRLMSEKQQLIGLGQDVMRGVFAVFVTIVHPNSPDSLTTLRPQVFEEAKRFQGSAFILQLTTTRSKLDQLTSLEIDKWIAIDFKRTTVLESHSTTDIDWAALRQNYINHIRQHFSHVEYIITFDSHITLLRWTPNLFAHTFGLKQLPNMHVVGPNRRQEYHHFVQATIAAWDAICANAMSVSRNGRFADSSNYRDYYMTDLNADTHSTVVHDPLDAAELVDSCYGGVAVYKTTRLLACSYESHRRSQSEPEHLALHRCMRTENMNVVFNPAMVVEYP